MSIRDFPVYAPPSRPRRLPYLIGALVILLLLSRTLASYLIEYEWWKEMGQVPTWLEMLLYRIAPLVASVLITFAVLWVAHARGMKFAGTSLRGHSLYGVIATVAMFAVATIAASGAFDSWTVVRYFGGRHLPPEATQWKDAVFGLPLRFYLFDLPFYSMLRGFFLTLTVAAALVYWVTARGWQLFRQLPEMQATAAWQAALSMMRLLASRGVVGPPLSGPSADCTTAAPSVLRPIPPERVRMSTSPAAMSSWAVCDAASRSQPSSAPIAYMEICREV